MMYIVVGATSVAGRATVEAIREFAPDTKILGTTSGAEDLMNCDETITGVDLSRSDAIEIIVKGVRGREVRKLFFTPSMGMVGYPSDEATQSDIETALSFSYRPLPLLAEKLDTSVVGYSSFYWLNHINVAYGAMAAAKYGIESLALARPDRFQVIRSGLFESKSLRGIILMVRRTLKTTTDSRLLSLQDEWKKSGLSFNEFFYKFAHGIERLKFQNIPEFRDIPHRKTSHEDLKEAVLRVLCKEPGPIYNVIGGWSWSENKPAGISEKELAPVKPYFAEMRANQEEKTKATA